MTSVLVWVGNVAAHEMISYLKDGEWQTSYCPSYIYSIYVAYWMPLPEKPKEWEMCVYESDKIMEHPDYDDAVDALAEGIREGTRLVIDCLGIRVNLAELESWGEYALLRRKMYGGFTSTRLYRLLFPHRHRRLYRAYIDAQLNVQQEFLVKVLDSSAEV